MLAQMLSIIFRRMEINVSSNLEPKASFSEDGSNPVVEEFFSSDHNEPTGLEVVLEKAVNLEDGGKVTRVYMMEGNHTSDDHPKQQ
ncbi:hypothetical protein ACS0TY_033203 [Phlomoides rotata]